MAPFVAVLRKDLLLEVRGGQSTVALGALSLLVLVVLVFAFNPGGGEQGAEAAAGAANAKQAAARQMPDRSNRLSTWPILAARPAI